MHPFFLCIIVVFELSHISPCLFTTQGQTVHKLQIAIFLDICICIPVARLKIWPFSTKSKPNIYFRFFLQIQSGINSTHPFYPFLIPNTSYVKLLDNDIIMASDYVPSLSRWEVYRAAFCSKRVKVTFFRSHSNLFFGLNPDSFFSVGSSSVCDSLNSYWF